MLSYLFHPNPGTGTYSSPKVLALLVVCILFLFVSFVVSRWRKKLDNPVTKKLSKSWAGALRWFAITCVFLVVCHVEQIQYVAMRALWVVWALALVVYAGVQSWLFKKKHYTVVKKEKTEDPREKYLPGK